MREVKAARLLSCWKPITRLTVSVEKDTYDELLYKVPPLFVGAEPDGTVKYVVLNREQATNFLQSEFNLYGTFDDSLRRDTIGESKD